MESTFLLIPSCNDRLHQLWYWHLSPPYCLFMSFIPEILPLPLLALPLSKLSHPSLSLPPATHSFDSTLTTADALHISFLTLPILVLPLPSTQLHLPRSPLLTPYPLLQIYSLPLLHPSFSRTLTFWSNITCLPHIIQCADIPILITL